MYVQTLAQLGVSTLVYTYSLFDRPKLVQITSYRTHSVAMTTRNATVHLSGCVGLSVTYHIRFNWYSSLHLIELVVTV